MKNNIKNPIAKWNGEWIEEEIWESERFGNSSTEYIPNIRPHGEKEGFTYWWDDVRPREIRELIKEAYEQGYNRGAIDATNRIKKFG